MGTVKERLHDFFFPPDGAPLWIRLLPYAILGVLSLALLISGAYAWEYTNSPEFCGTACHTMPPEYTRYLVSPHARVACVECHIGRGFIATRVTRKAGDLKHVVSLLFKEYEYPIMARDLRPARETCERCHSPEKFSDDSLREIKRFSDDPDNTATSIYLIMHTGGGSKREGLGRGIHWHIESQVDYLPTDEREQQIPYVRVVEDDGSITEYVEVGSDLDPASIDETKLRRMDCITCHNRISHLILPPDDAVDQLMARGLVSPAIPEIRHRAVETLRGDYQSNEIALQAIAGLEGYYKTYYPDFYQANQELIRKAIRALQDTYQQSVFPEQKADWDTHPNNVGHRQSPGCFRCHDGKHLNAQGEAIRLECNLCHSIPVVVEEGDFIADIEISLGPEPETHLNANWIALHRDVFDPTCANCHSTQDPGGTSNTSFCSNSACHGAAWEYAGFDAPGLREILKQQLPPTPTPSGPVVSGPLTWQATIGPLLQARCGTCHGEKGIKGLNLTSYQGAMAGGEDGPAIIPGDPAASPLVKKQSGEEPHFGQLNPEELSLVTDWIAAGAPEQ